MIILRRPEAAYRRVDLAVGAWIDLRPATTPDFNAAQAAFARAAKASADTAALAAAYALPFAPAAAENADAVNGLHQVIYWTEVAALCARSIGGFAREDGSEASLDRETLALIMLNHGWQMRIVMELSREIHELSAEGNASAASAPGAPGAAIPTAPDAAPTGSPAPTAAS